MKARVLMTIAILLATSAHAQTRDTPRSVIDRFLGAVNHLSVEEMSPLFTSDATAFLPTARFGGRLTGRDAILNAFGAMFAHEKKRLAELVRPGGGKNSNVPLPPGTMAARDVVLQPIGTEAFVVTFDVGTGNLSSRRTAVVVKRGGRWQILHMHASNLRLQQ